MKFTDRREYTEWYAGKRVKDTSGSRTGTVSSVVKYDDENGKWACGMWLRVEVSWDDGISEVREICYLDVI